VSVKREEAQKIVDGVTFNVEQPAPYPPCKAVSVRDARRLIGDKHFDRLAADRIRGRGPLPETFYPWNVVDYLVPAENEREHERGTQQEQPNESSQGTSEAGGRTAKTTQDRIEATASDEGSSTASIAGKESGCSKVDSVRA
jgi:hypothetical protein